MGYTNVHKIGGIIFLLCAAQTKPQLKYQPCLVLGNMERRWPTGKSPDERNKNNHIFYEQNLSKLRVLQVKEERLFSDSTESYCSLFFLIFGPG